MRAIDQTQSGKRIPDSSQSGNSSKAEEQRVKRIRTCVHDGSILLLYSARLEAALDLHDVPVNKRPGMELVPCLGSSKSKTATP